MPIRNMLQNPDHTSVNLIASSVQISHFAEPPDNSLPGHVIHAYMRKIKLYQQTVRGYNESRVRTNE